MSPDDNFREVYGWVSGADPAAAKVEAESTAKAAASRIERSKKKLELSMPGTLAVVAGAIINLSGFRPQVNGRFKIVEVRHSIDRGGWLTAATCEAAGS